MGTALFVFAHQDDEYGSAPWLAEEVDLGHSVYCIYLTDGASRTDSSVRDAESIDVLGSLGVKREAVHFLGAPNARVPDLALASRSETAWAMLENWLESQGIHPDRLYAPAYEGGHPDHDAAHVITALVAAKREILDCFWHFPLYNAYRCPKPLFRSLVPLVKKGAEVRKARLRLSERWKLAMLCWRYRSQRRTWIGLFPEAFLRRVVLGGDSVARFDYENLFVRPHPGELLYERMFGTNYLDFVANLSPLMRHLARAGNAR
jgi:LmbE family N-acetylglucosaminyl deacetylase